MNSEKMTKRNAQDHPFEVFFDGQCPLCRREIAMIRRWDRKHQLRLTDIADPAFVAQEREWDVLMREIHGRSADGTFVTGVEVFREIYQRLGWGGTVRMSRIPGIRHMLDAGYRAFAVLRYHHAMRRFKGQAQGCVPCRVPGELAATPTVCEPGHDETNQYLTSLPSSATTNAAHNTNSHPAANQAS